MKTTWKEKIADWFVLGVWESLKTGVPNIRFKLAMVKVNEYFRRNEMNDQKKWYASKTLWFNFLSGLVTFVVSLQGTAGLSPEAQKIAGAVILGGNMILRFLTDSPIGTTNTPKQG